MSAPQPPDAVAHSLPAQGPASDRSMQGTQEQQGAIGGLGQGAQSGYSHPQQQPSSYQPYPMPGLGTSTALQHLANSPYASYAMPATPYAQLPPPPPASSLPSTSSATPAQQLRYNVPHPDAFNLLPLPSHQYAPIGMSYVPYPPPAPIIASQPPLATTVPLPISGPVVTRPPVSGHVYSQLPPPPPRGPSAADDPEALLPLPPSAFAGRSASMTSGADSAQAGLNGAQQDEDEDLPLRLPTPPSDFVGGSDDDGDYQPQAGPSGSRSKKRTGSPSKNSLPAKRPRVSVSAAEAARRGKGGGANGDKKQPLAGKKKRGPNKKKPRLLKGEEPPPGVETTVDGSWRRKMSRGGWGGPGGPGGRPETFLRKLWKLMQDPNTDVSAYMHWDASGKLLIIPDEQALVENVCKVHFAQKSITSFNKQMNNWDFKRHARSQRDLAIISQTEPNVTRNTRIWYHPSLVATSTLDDVQNVVRHEDGMAKKRRIKSKHTGVLEEGVGTGRGKRAKVIPPTMAGEFSTLSPAPSSSEAAPSVSGSQSESEKKVHPTRGRASATASGSGPKRKRLKYAEMDSEDFSDTTHDQEFPSDDADDDDDDEDEDAEGETDDDAAASPSANEKKKGAGGGTSDEDAEGEPDEDLYAKQPLPAAVDVKGKGKAKAVSSEPLMPAAGKGKGRLAASSASRPRKTTTTASVPTSRQPAKKGAIKQQRVVKDSQAGEPTEAENDNGKDNISPRRPRRSSALAAISAQRKQLTYDSSEDDAAPPPPKKKAPIENKADAEKKEPAAPAAKPTRTARRRSSIVVEEEEAEAEEAVPPTAGPSDANTKQAPTPKGKRAVNKPVDQQQKDTPPAATRRTRASRGGAEVEPELGANAVAVVEAEPKAAPPAPTRRSARASGVRAAKEADADEAVAQSAPVGSASAPAAEGGPSTGTRRASRGGRAYLATTDAAPGPLAKADEPPAPATASRRGRGAAAATSAGRGAKSGSNRGRGGATAASSSRGRGAATSSRGMRRGGAGFRGGVQPVDGATDEQETASASVAREGVASGSRTPHVYSLPRPPHLDKLGGTADSSREASVDASAEAGPSNNGVARSPSAASSRYLYPDATNPYGSSPYPAYPHQAQTPVMQHQHPTRPHRVYHSEPGLARTAFYYHGVSPLPRPYIHPEHDLPDEVLENGDEASVFGGDFAAPADASSSALGMAARAAGAHALAAYRNGSPVARGPTFERSPASGQFGPVGGLPPRKPTTQSQVSDVRASLEADQDAWTSTGLAAKTFSGEAPAAEQRHVYTVPTPALGGEAA